MTRDKEAKPPGREVPVMTILSDHPILGERVADPDRLDLNPKLGSVLDILRHKATQSPIAIAIRGGWGTGKSSAMRWLRDQLNEWNKLSEEERKEHPVVASVWFDPWKYHKREDVWRGLIAEVILHCFTVSTMTRENLPTRLRQAAKRFGRFLGAAFLDALANVEINAEADVKAGRGGVKVSGEIFRDVYDEYAKANHPEKAYLNEFESTLREWVQDFFPQTATDKKQPRRLALFIDDLDRCMPLVTLEVLEALKLYLNIPGLMFVVGLDRDVVDAVVKKQYAEHGLGEDKSGQYLDKLFQVEIDIAPTQTRARGFLTEQVEAMNQATHGYWGRMLDDVNIQHSKSTRVLIESKIETLCGNNPREIKRLLNNVLLRADAAARNKKIKSYHPLTFAQGAQVYLVQRFVSRDFLYTSGLLLHEEVQRFFLQWSLFVKKYPWYRSVGREDSTDAGVSEVDGVRPPAKRPRDTKEPRTQDLPHNEAVEEFTKLADHQPKYEDYVSGQKGPIALLQNDDLWDLMSIPFSLEVAGETAIEDGSKSEGLDAGGISLAAQRGAPEATKDQRRSEPRAAEPASQPASLQAMPAVLVNAIARSLKKAAKDLTTGDLNQVRQLTLVRPGFDDAGLAHVGALPGLQELNLHGTKISDAGLAHVGALTGLQSLSLTSTQISDAGLAHLGALTSLRSIGLDNTKISDAGLAHLAALTSLQSLGLGGTQITDEMLGHLATLTGLKALYMWKTQISDAGLAHLGGLMSLRVLYLSDTRITSEGLVHLGALTGLQSLYLRGTQITDAGLAHLGSLTGLQILDLSGTQITDAGLAHLGSLTGLQILDLSGTQITEAGLAHLGAMPGLQRLDLSGTKISDAAIKELIKKIPGLKVLR
jgi:Leucine-rich repeat (LRR) protein